MRIIIAIFWLFGALWNLYFRNGLVCGLELIIFSDNLYIWMIEGKK